MQLHLFPMPYCTLLFPTFSPLAYIATVTVSEVIAESSPATNDSPRRFMRNSEGRRSLPNRTRKQQRPAMDENMFIPFGENSTRPLSPTRRLSQSSGVYVCACLLVCVCICACKCVCVCVCVHASVCVCDSGRSQKVKSCFVLAIIENLQLIRKSEQLTFF